MSARVQSTEYEYGYDAYGQRIVQLASDGDILNEYNRDGKPVWMANRREGGIAHTYLYLGNQLVATQIYDAATNPVLYQTTDTLGSVVAQTNQEAWVDHFNYYQPWGGLQSGSLDDGPGYANQINDTNTGLSYAQQRYYDTSVGRFMSMDPVDANTATGGNFNRYVYANDNPYRFTDPDGRQECTAGREQTNEHCGPPPTTTGCLTTGSEAQQQPADRKLTNVVYNESGSLRANTKVKPGAAGSAEDLGKGRQAIAEIANRVIDAGHPNRVAPSDLRDNAAMKTDAYGNSRTAADAALDGSNISNGATQYRTRVGDDVTTPVGRSSTDPGTPVSQHYGPFIEGNHTVVIVVAQ